MTFILTRRTAFISAFSILSTPLLAQILNGPGIKFSKTAFEAAQAADQSIIVEVTAPWCPVCKVQKPILAALKDKPEFANVAIFEIDFDSQKDLLQLFRVSKQSTLIAFRGKIEKSRLIGETKPEVIETLVKTTI